MRIFLSKFIDWLLFAFLFLLPWQTRWIWHWGEINGAPWEYGTYSVYGTEILFWLAAIFLLIKLWRQQELKIIFQEKSKIVYGFMGLMVLFFILAVVHSLSPDISYQFVFHLLEGLVLVSVIYILSQTNKLFTHKLLNFLWAGGVAQGLFALWQFLSQSIPANKWLGLASHIPQDLGASVVEFGDERWLRAYGSFGSPNSLGIYLAVCLVMGLILYLRLSRCLPLVPARLGREGEIKRGCLASDKEHPTLPACRQAGPPPQRGEDKWRILITVGQMIIAIGLVLSFSRSAWLAAGCGVVVLFLLIICRRESICHPERSEGSSPLSRSRSFASLWMTKKCLDDSLKGFLKQILFILAPILCLFLIFQPVFLARFNTENRLENKSVTERMFQYIEMKNTFLQSPWLGVGPGAYTLALSKIEPWAKGYELQPVHNIYLLFLAEWGVVGFMGLVVYGFMGLMIWRKNRVFISVLVVLLVAGLFDHWNYTLYTGLILWWVVWGLGLQKS